MAATKSPGLSSGGCDVAARPAVDAAAATVGRVLAGGETVYGVNTGFGLLARTRIDNARLTDLGAQLKQRYEGLLDRTALYQPYQPDLDDPRLPRLIKELNA